MDNSQFERRDGSSHPPESALRNRAQHTPSSRARSRVSSAAIVIAGLGALSMVALPHRPSNVEPVSAELAAALSSLPTDDSIDRVRALLAPPVSETPPDEVALVNAIVRIGPPALDVCVGMLCGEIAPPEFAVNTPDGDIHPAAIEGRERFLRTAIGRFDSSRRLECFARLGTGASLDVRLVLIGLLGETMHSRAADEILRLTEGVEEIHLHRDYVTRVIETSLAARFVSSPLTMGELRPKLQNAPIALAVVAARAVARVESAPAAQLLGELLGRDGDLDAVLLRGLAGLARSGRVTIDDSALERARRTLDGEHREAICRAAELLGIVGDERDAARLVELLSAGDVIVTRAARTALTVLVGTDLGAHQEAWDAWLRGETDWIESELETTLSDFGSDSPSEALDALRAFVRHRLAWRAGSARLAEVLASTADDAVSASLVEAIVTTGARSAIPVLIDELEHEDEARRARAQSALKGLTGLDLGPERFAWLEVFGASR